MRIAGRTAVITGAASGIGRGTALALARRGCHLALADIDEAGLAETKALAGEQEVRITTHRLDVADRAAVAAFPEAVLEAHGGAQMLFNNAGVAVGGSFEQVAEADFEWLMNINFYGVVRMTRAFLPLLRAADEARIVNISSLFGLIAPPGQTAYAASKFAVRGFSEALRRELEEEGTRIGVTTVHPGGVATSIASNARLAPGLNGDEFEKRRAKMEKLLRMPPLKAGEIIVTGVARGRARVIVGNDAKFAALIERVAPVGYWKLLGKGLK
jgi:NAD(P)-dependent dehydrogenase (short-subunit alcohol dehydrogenase family)